MHVKNGAVLASAKRKFAKTHKVSLPTNIKLLAVYRSMAEEEKIKRNKDLERLLRTKAIRTLSGVTVISLLTKPATCPGNCLYCPKEPKMPKSYLSNEPAVMRAILCGFDPYRQVKTRLQSLDYTGHDTSKIEIIILGGTFSSLSKPYRTNFIKRILDALNEKNAKTLEQAKKWNEGANHRMIGLTIETRPDFITSEEILYLRKLGTTRVELGVQNINEKILKKNRRGHGLKEIVQATFFLKEAGFKVSYHLMPGLWGATTKSDYQMFKKIFSDERFQPDLLKIYPTVVVKESALYKLWLKKKYHPYSNRALIKLLVKIKKIIPPYVRISRLVRDIPSTSIIAGSKISNLRQLLGEKAKKEGWRCMCIRCREPRALPPKKLKLFRQDYYASGGLEIFLSYEDLKRKNLFALLRLRIPASVIKKTKPIFPILKDAAIIREVHTYGLVAPVGKKIKKATQHKGLGKKLVLEAEKIVQKEFGIKKMAVISGIGVRDYYRKFGYKLRNEYMIKNLKFKN